MVEHGWTQSRNRAVHARGAHRRGRTQRILALLLSVPLIIDVRRLRFANVMTAENDQGQCETCHKNFGYRLIHNGFNSTVYAYCAKSGEISLLSLWNVPQGIEIKEYGVIPQQVELLLNDCECGGTFRKGTSPRCPHCNSELSAIAAAKYIEANAPATGDGWRWQQSWEGLYAIIVQDKCIDDNWKEAADR